MSTDLSRVYQRIDRRADDHLELLSELVRKPSRTGFLDEVRQCADYLVDLLASGGWRAEAVPIDRLAPVVFAERPARGAERSVLLYSHYDVISPEPLDAWTYPPFAATRVDGRIIGRGTTDAKANVLALIKAVDTLVEVEGETPCSVQLILDGDEERGSPGLPLFMDRFEPSLVADAALSLDGGIDPSGVPKIGLGTSGMLYLELSCQGAPRELHSAASRLFANPAWRLVWALASLKTPGERMLIDGYDADVVPPSERDLELLEAMPWDDRRQLEEAGVSSFLTGVRGRAAVRRLLFEPGLAICGLVAGYGGPGPKAVIPDRAAAKLEFRIVPDQTPERVADQLRAHLDRHGFDDVTIEVLAAVETAKTDPDAAIVAAAIEGARAFYGEPMVKPTEEYAGRQGAWLGRRLGIPGVQTGIGPPGHRGHAADEFVTEEHFITGIKLVATILDRFGKP